VLTFKETMVVRGTWQSLALAAVAALSVACGAHPTNPRPIKLAGTQAPTEAPVATPTPLAVPGGDPARTFLAQASAAFRAMPAYEARMDFFQKAGKTSSRGSYELAGRQPRTLKLFVREGSGEGTKLLWKGGEMVKVRPAGFLSAVTVELAQTDERLISVRGYTLGDTDIPALFGYFADPANRVTGPETTADGLMLKATGTRFPKGVVSMTGIFDAKTLLPSKVEMSDGREVVLRFVISNMRAKRDISLEI
jgi:hypothetical protein